MVFHMLAYALMGPVMRPVSSCGNPVILAAMNGDNPTEAGVFRRRCSRRRRGGPLR
jgi:hypothetical protein